MRATTAFNKPFFRARGRALRVHRIDDGGKEKEKVYIARVSNVWMDEEKKNSATNDRERNSCSQSETSLALSFPKDRKLCRDPVYSSIPAFRRIKTSSILFVASF